MKSQCPTTMTSDSTAPDNIAIDAAGSACSEWVESPCIKVCMLDAGQMCVGCGRTLNEITAWSRLTNAQRHQVRREAAKRLQAQVGRGIPPRIAAFKRT